MTRRILATSIMVALAIVSVVIGYVTGARHQSAQFVEGATTTVTVAKVPSLPGFKPTWSGTGTLVVPLQVSPGAYLVAPDDNALGCVWVRLKSTDGRVKSIIASGQMARGATPQMMTVDPKDKFVQFLGGCAFRKVS